MIIVKRTGCSLRRLTALTLGIAALSAPGTALAQDAQAENGFALLTTLAARFGVVATGSAGAFAGSGIQGDLTAGYKFGRVFIGLGLEFSNFTANTTGVVAGVQTSITTSDSSFLIGPEAQFAILRSPDSRVEMIGDLAIHFGHLFSETTPSPAATTGDSNFLLSYRIGPGVRFWAHKHFAVQATTGFSGQAYFDLPVAPAPANGNNSQHGIYGAFGAMGVF